jgi:acyl carrier protein
MKNNINITMKEISLFLTKNNDIEIKESDNLFDLSLLDSMGILEIIAIIEKFTNQDISPDLIVMQNFQSIKNIENLVNKIV